MKLSRRLHKVVRNFRIVNNISSTDTQEFLTFNLDTKLVKIKTMEGRKHFVCPMVMMVEGVLNGSQGPILYRGKEMRSAPSNWDHKPIVRYHPTINGRGVSACIPDILTQQKVGVILNTRVDNKGPNGAARLCADAWIEMDRVDKVDKRIGETIRNQKMMELSTGLFMDKMLEEGDWNGKPYEAIASNFRPDHLALLPDKKGASSIADGAGFIRNEKVRNEGDHKMGDEFDENTGGEDEADLKGRDGTITGDEDEDDDDDADNFIDLGIMNQSARVSQKRLDEHLAERAERVHTNVANLIKKARMYANSARKTRNQKVRALYHRNAAKAYDQAGIQNYRNKGPVKTEILCRKCAGHHYDMAEACSQNCNVLLKKKKKMVRNAKNAGDTGADGQDAMISTTVVGVTPANPTKDKKKNYNGMTNRLISGQPKHINILQRNELSSEDTRQALARAIREKFGKKDAQGNMSYDVYVCDVFQTFCVFSEGYGYSQRMWKINYVIDDEENVTLGATRTEVVRFTQYKTKVGGKTVTNILTNGVIDNYRTPGAKDKKKRLVRYRKNRHEWKPRYGQKELAMDFSSARGGDIDTRMLAPRPQAEMDAIKSHLAKARAADKAGDRIKASLHRSRANSLLNNLEKRQPFLKKKAKPAPQAMNEYTWNYRTPGAKDKTPRKRRGTAGQHAMDAMQYANRAKAAAVAGKTHAALRHAEEASRSAVSASSMAGKGNLKGNHSSQVAMAHRFAARAYRDASAGGHPKAKYMKEQAEYHDKVAASHSH